MPDQRTAGPSRFRLLPLATAIAVALLALVEPAPAGARPSQDPPPEDEAPPAVSSWALAPTGTDPSQPSSRPYLSYAVAPGETIKDSVTLWNYGNVQLTFQIYATDAFNTATGAFELLTGDKPPTDVGSWVTLPQENVTVPPQSKIDLPFTLVVPEGARAGDHAGAVLAASRVEGLDGEGKTVALDRRTGARLYLRVGGDEVPSLAVESVYSVFHGGLNPLDGRLDVTYTVRNSGNLRLAGRQEIVLKSPFGRVMKRLTPDDLPELLPGNAITLTAHFDHLTAAFRVGAEVSVTPFSEASPDLEVDAVSRTGRTWAVPWVVIALVVIVYLVGRMLRRARRRLRRPPPRAPRQSPSRRAPSLVP